MYTAVVLKRKQPRIVVAEPWNVPAEVLEEKTGPVINLDDVLDFSLALKKADLLSAMASCLPPNSRRKLS